MPDFECTNCKQHPNLFDGKCIEYALNSIRLHFLNYKNLLLAREQEIQELQAQNARFAKAMEMMCRAAQQQSRRQPADEDFHKQTESQTTGRSITTEPSYTDSDDLNRAFDSEDLLYDCPELLCSSPNEAEISKSPREIPTNTLKKPSSPRVKNLNERYTIFNDHNLRIKTKKYACGAQENLTTQKKRKRDAAMMLEKTRLHFDETKSTEISLSSCSDAISASPVKKKAKNTRRISSWLQSLTSLDVADNDSGMPCSLTPRKNLTNAKYSPDMNISLDAVLTSLSLVIISPEPPEIVFLDESTDEEEEPVKADRWR